MNLKELINLNTGKIGGLSTVNKFGSNADVGTTYEPINTLTAPYNYSTTATIYYISSSDNGDTQIYEIQGLDENWNLQTLSVTAVGQTKTAINGKWLRIFRIKNLGSTNNAGSVYVYEDDTVTLGVPDTATKLRARIEIGLNQTQMAQYTVPKGHKVLITSLDVSVGKDDKEITVGLFAKDNNNGGIFLLKYEGEVYRDKHTKVYEKALLTFGEKVDIELQAKADVAGATLQGTFDLILVNLDKYNS